MSALRAIRAYFTQQSVAEGAETTSMRLLTCLTPFDVLQSVFGHRPSEERRERAHGRSARSGPAFSAQEEPEAAHVPGRDWAKVVVCVVDGQPIEALLPAPFIVDLERLLQLARGARSAWRKKKNRRTFLTAVSQARFCPSVRHVDLVVIADFAWPPRPRGPTPMRSRCVGADFARTVRPIVALFAEAPLDHVGEYRLLFRE